MITIQQYENAVRSLSSKRREILGKLYYIEPASDANEIAARLGYKGFGGANLQIGSIGKAICSFLEIKPDLSDYNDDIEEGGYFIVVHRQMVRSRIYWEMELNLRYALENLGIAIREVSLDLELLTTEISRRDVFSEGSLITVTVDRRERDREARRIALEKHGNICKGCAIDFKQKYGDDTPAIIEIHHVRPLNIEGERNTNPETDLIPLCPNCHAVVHSLEKLMTIEELQRRIRSNRN